MPKRYSKGRKCCNCGGSKTYIKPDGRYSWYSCQCHDEDCTKYLCEKCYKKSFTDWRNGNLDPSSNSGKGFIGSRIVANTYKMEDCSIVKDNFHFYIDLFKRGGYGYVEVKTSSLDKIREIWNFNTARQQEYENIFLVCMDIYWPWKRVERIYIIPWEVVGYRTGIAITKNPSKGNQWYEEFRTNEIPFNETYHRMKLENCDILRKNK